MSVAILEIGGKKRELTDEDLKYVRLSLELKRNQLLRAGNAALSTSIRKAYDGEAEIMNEIIRIFS